MRSTRSHHVNQRTDGTIRGCVLRLQCSSLMRTDLHNRYCDSKTYHLETQLSLDRRWRPRLLRILPVEVGSEDLTTRPQRSMVVLRYPGIWLRAVSKKYRTGSTMVLPILKQKQKRSPRRLGQSLVNTETHKQGSRVRSNSLRSSHPRYPGYPAAIKHSPRRSGFWIAPGRLNSVRATRRIYRESQEDVESYGEAVNGS